ncbi:glycoside hydrolase family 5 protein [Asticcacaulis solisilvae]|uniref:glycoside hydrolase family 5 protein n=1 Tax=Asticcacaulis solisilvae TaxID=1217274 RepID=UPI003FD80D0C
MRLKALCLAAAIAMTAPAVHAADLIAFWNTPQHGGNSFNGSPPDLAYFKALRATGATWVRLTFTKWKGEGRDFLIGDADHYAGIPASDLATLRRVLDAADAAGLKVVIAPLSLPGDRWNQQNGNKQDERLWNDRVYWQQSAAFWRDLATALKDHPAVAGYNLLNEPTPEKGMGLDEHATPEVRQAWYAKYKGTTHDLPGFYQAVIAAIREVDPSTPVMVDGGWYANAWSFSYWPGPLGDSKVLYAFHMYEPYEATSGPNIKRKPQLRYPGVTSWLGGEQVTWDRATVARYLDGPFQWAAAHGVPENRMVAGEFGCVRMWSDCGTYLNDVLDTLNSHHSHWAFYSFREDVWDAMDYELAPDVTSGQFYYATEQGRAADLKRTPHPLLDIIEAHMK